MRIYPQRSWGVGPDMRNECTCGHCRLAHVKRESNTARVYKMQLPPIKIKKTPKTQPKKTAPKLVYGYQSVPKTKKVKKPALKSVVRSKPEYDAWYFSEADLHTIAHSNMENYLSRFQPDLQEAATQTSPKFGKKSLKDEAVQIALSLKGLGDSSKQYKDRGDSPTRTNSPMALSALLNYKQATGDFSLEPPSLKLKANIGKKPHLNDTDKIISMPPKPVSEIIESLQNGTDRAHPRKSHWTDTGFKPGHMADLDDFMKSIPTDILHSRSKNHLKELLDLDKYRQPQGISDKLSKRLKHDKKYKMAKHPKVSRKLLETSLKKEKEARRSLKIENDGLKNCISKAEQKVRDIRMSLAELSTTITAYKTRTGLPYANRVEKLEKLVDELIKEFRSSNKIKSNVPNSPRKWVAQQNHTPQKQTTQVGQQKNTHANYVVVSTSSPNKDARKGNELNNHSVDFFEMGEIPDFDDEALKNFDWSHLSISSVSGLTVSSNSTSLTALKQELSTFFEEMKVDTEKLIEEAHLHHEALMAYSNSTSSVPSCGFTSAISS